MDSNDTQIYESISKLYKMSAIEFCEYMGVELTLYQKIMLHILEKCYFHCSVHSYIERRVLGVSYWR